MASTGSSHFRCNTDLGPNPIQPSCTDVATMQFLGPNPLELSASGTLVPLALGAIKCYKALQCYVQIANAEDSSS